MVFTLRLRHTFHVWQLACKNGTNLGRTLRSTVNSSFLKPSVCVMFRFLCPFLLISATSLGADLILQPEGLSVGDRYRLFFTTSESRDASSTDIEDYHEFVQSVADAAPDVGSWGLQWSAVAGTRGSTAWDNSDTSPTRFGFELIPAESKIPVYRVDGELMWFDYQHMWNFLVDSVFATPTITEIGSVYEGDVWTGTIDADNPGNSPLGVESPYLGLSTSTSAFIWNGGARRDLSTELHPLYAISDVITVIPEPSSMSLILSLVSLGFVFRRRRP